ncbi:MAG: DUF1801 domain-containing protein [Kofleriaceae bacterium]
MARAKTTAKVVAKAKPVAKAKKGMPKGKLRPNKDGVVLLSGGNPQIPKGDGDAPVQAYIKAMPGWKHGIAKALDALVMKTVPVATKAVKWNSPFYGIGERSWFVSMHAFDKWVRVTFFKGIELSPMPPGGTPKSGKTRWVDIREGDLAGGRFANETQLVAWLKEAASIPGWDGSSSD